jgi:N-acetylmuramoyl-L-alanine amidase
VRYWTHPDYTRIVVELDDYAPYKFEFLPRPSRLYFDLMTARLSGGLIRGATYEVPDDPAISKIRVGQNRRTMARIVFDLADEVAYNVSWLSGPPRLVIELRSKSATPVRFAKADPPKPAIPRAELPASARPAPPAAQPLSAPAVEPLAARVETSSKSFQEAFRELTTGGRVVEVPLERVAPQAPVVQARFEPPKAAPVAPAVIDAAPPKEASANSSGHQTLIRALGLKIGRIVIDAGHGGHDPGNIGPSGVQEKRIVLDISKRLGKLVEDRLGAEVVHTRVSDGFIDLTKRTQIANQAAADLFVSVHANSARQKNVRGVETFYLNLTSDPYALQVAARENAAANRSVHELQDLLGKIALKERIDESREFANKMQSALYGGLATTTKGLRNRGVRQAPFLVLIGAKMPAILAEVGFMSNATDEKLLNTPAYRQKVAEFIYQGIAAYVDTLSAHELTMTDEPTASAALD